MERYGDGSQRKARYILDKETHFLLKSCAREQKRFKAIHFTEYVKNDYFWTRSLKNLSGPGGETFQQTVLLLGPLVLQLKILL